MENFPPVSTHNRLMTFSASLIILTLVVWILNLGQTIIIPIVLAIIAWFLTITLVDVIHRIPLGKFRTPNWLAFIIAIGIFGTAIWLFARMINSNLSQIIDLAPIYQARLDDMLVNFYNFVGMKAESQKTIDDLLHEIDLTDLATTLLSAFTSFVSYATMTFIYFMFLLLEYSTFDVKLGYLFPNAEHHKKVDKVVSKISTDIKTYLRIKTFISLSTATLTYFVLAGFGVDFAIFWAVLTFFLNFIPTIGSILAVIFPVVFTIIQFGTAGTIFGVAILLGVIQFSLGNVIEPRLTGRSLNLSPLVILIALAFWGAVWGILGMFISVPIMVILNIILAKFTATHPLAVLLSADGEVGEPMFGIRAKN